MATYRVCAVNGCNNIKYYVYVDQENVGRKFHKFPKDRDRCFQWIEALKRTDLMRVLEEKGPMELWTWYRVCSDHFLDSDYVKYKKRGKNNTSLSKSAVPSANLCFETVDLPASVLEAATVDESKESKVISEIMKEVELKKDEEECKIEVVWNHMEEEHESEEYTDLRIKDEVRNEESTILEVCNLEEKSKVVEKPKILSKVRKKEFEFKEESSKEVEFKTRRRKDVHKVREELPEVENLCKDIKTEFVTYKKTKSKVKMRNCKINEPKIVHQTKTTSSEEVNVIKEPNSEKNEYKIQTRSQRKRKKTDAEIIEDLKEKLAATEKLIRKYELESQLYHNKYNKITNKSINFHNNITCEESKDCTSCQKDFALELYQKSPEVYRDLQEKFSLPDTASLFLWKLKKERDELAQRTNE